MKDLWRAPENLFHLDHNTTGPKLLSELAYCFQQGKKKRGLIN